MVIIWNLYGIYMVFNTYQERRQIEFSRSACLYGTKFTFSYTANKEDIL